MAVLPVELLERIFELSLPPTPPAIREITSTAVSPRPLACWTTWKERSATLRTFSVVCRRWRDWAQRELWRHCVLRDEIDIRLLLEAGSAMGVEQRRRRGFVTETVRLGGAENGRPLSGRDLGAVLRLLQADEVAEGEGIKELWLVTMRGVDLREIRHLNDLRTLFCDGITLSVPTGAPQTPVRQPPLRLPRLRSVTLQLVDIDPSLRTIMFENHRFPSLEILDFDNFEALTQCFDGNPDAMPELKAIDPAGDTQAEYFAALQKDDFGDVDAVSSAYETHVPSGPTTRADLPPPPPAGPLPALPAQSCATPLPASPYLPPYGWPVPLSSVSYPLPSPYPWLPDVPPSPDGLLTIWMSDDFLRYLPYFAPSLPNDLVKLTLNFSIDDVEREHFEEFLTNEDFLRILAPEQSTSTRSSQGHTGVTHIHASDSAFLLDLTKCWPDLLLLFLATLEARGITLSQGTQLEDQDRDDEIGTDGVEARMNLDFLRDAERVIRRENDGQALMFSDIERMRFENHNEMCRLNGQSEDIKEAFQPTRISIVPYSLEDTFNPDWRPPRVEEY
ncbi:serine/arginine repetitive matrix protein 2 [Rhodotorula toruloides]|uniref:Serine/arginine repetitive matrix protein 2 n=1 Tax=Rhodotorula toruloides TaxID=5286 RepID=A0A511KMY9_RHOTO|nr:serine/arginine repetitive matrix protein 2 [Rhodotorula toruloides]